MQINSEISELLINSIDAEKIRANLHEFTREMHIGGSGGATRLADLIKDKYTQYGLEGSKADKGVIFRLRYEIP